MITSINYPKLNKHKIIFNDACVPGMEKIFINFENFDNIYPNKKITIITDKEISLSGTLILDGNKKYSLLLDNYITNGGEYINSGFYFESFDNNSDDNQILSVSQLKNQLNSKENQYDETGFLIAEGSKGLIEPNEKDKLVQLKTEIFKNQKININTLTTTKIGNVIIPDFYSNNKIQKFIHIFSIVGKNFNCKLKISLSNFDNEIGQFEVEILEYSTSQLLKNLRLILNLSKNIVTSTNKNFLSINAKFDKSKLTEEPLITDLIYNVIHEISETKNLFFNNNDLGVVSTTTPLQYKKLDNSLSPDFIIDSNTLKYTSNKINYLSEKKLSTKIVANSNLDNFKIPGNYYTVINENFSSIQNKPTNNNQKFLLEVIDFNIEQTLNEKCLLQRYSCWSQIGTTQNYQILLFERISVTNNNIFSWSPWIETAKKIHTHSATDIIETTTKRFVSQVDVNNWNSILSSTTLSTWKPPVATYLSLIQTYISAQKGWSVYVFETNSVWIYNGIDWINQTPICNVEENGLVSKEQFLEYFEGAGISKKIRAKESFINRLTENPEEIYGYNYEKINEFHIDEVKRIIPITDILKQYTIQRGWNVNIFGSNSFVTGKDINSNYDNSIGLGIGLEYSSNDQTIFGKYNLRDSDLSFIIGNGTSNTNRTNLFSINKNGILKAQGYSIQNGLADDILTANGSKISKNNLIQTILQGVTQSKTEIILINDSPENFILDWTEERYTKYGNFGTFEVWLETGENIYNKEEIPVKMITEINIETNELNALSYTFNLSGLNGIILIK